MRVGRVLRGSRAAVFTVVCVALSAGAHVWMSGRAIPAWAMAVAAVGVFAAAWGLAGRRRGLASISVLMLCAQACQHLLFAAAQHAAGYTAGGGAPAPGAPAMSMPMPGMPMPGMLMPGMATSGPPTPGLVALFSQMVMGHGPWGMAVAHGAAGLACAWWLHRGEAELFRLLLCLALAVLGRWARAAVERAPVPAAAPTFFGIAPPRGVRDCALLAHVLARRGPPALLGS